MELGFRDASEFVEASYRWHPERDIEPAAKAPYCDLSPEEKSERSALSPVEQAALRYVVGLEPRPMRVVAEELGVSIEAISKVKRAIEDRVLPGTRRRKSRAVPVQQGRPLTTQHTTRGQDSTLEALS